jgi:hypothetical protein
MILNNAPANEAIVSNVGEIGEFRIRNSAKAFSILSSGLYANKIRAIIRELSCNAVDSHTAAGKTDTPFDVHLPNTLEPHFSIRDYGTGLSHEQVTNIYTTYFESTKTNSNAFIGALGLGSKSPFSYTDNFTVTAIQNGRKGIYTAFINEAGVPSIAQMMEEATDEPAGVEVKFGVNDRYDFDKFRTEARNVYKYFALRPVVTGNSQFTFEDAEYESKNIIPGVHSQKSASRSVAIMGNIAYPIDLPAGSDVGGLNSLLGCGLEMHFGIGELDFQASREGLSYIPSTVAAIKAKLEALNAALSVVIATEADAIENLWDRSVFLHRKKEHKLWTTAVQKYAVDTKLPTYNVAHNYGARPTTFSFKIEDLAKDWNIHLRQISRGRGSKTVTNCKPSTEYPAGHPKNAAGHYITWQEWNIHVDADSHFVINDLKTGAGGRATYHYRETDCNVYQRHVWILEKADKSKDMDLKAFFAAIYEPPTARRFAASTLLKREVEKLGRNISILKLEKRGGRGYRRSDEDMVWRDAGDTAAFPDKDAQGNTIYYYYVPLSGFVMESAKGYSSGKQLYDDVKSVPGLHNGEIYGVRKKDIEDIRLRKNWKNFEDHIETVLNGKDTSKLLMGLVKSRLEHVDMLNFSNQNILPFIDDNSPYKKFVLMFQKVDKPTGNSYTIESLFRRFASNANLDPTALVTKYQSEANEVNRRYPLLSRLSTYRVEAGDIAEYVNLIDAKKGIKNESI